MFTKKELITFITGDDSDEFHDLVSSDEGAEIEEFLASHLVEIDISAYDPEMSVDDMIFSSYVGDWLIDMSEEAKSQVIEAAIVIYEREYE